MSIWKTLIIVAMIAGLAGYGFYQQSASQSVTPPPAQPNATQIASTNDTASKLKKLIGTQPHPWSISADLWANTKAPINLPDLKGHVAVIEFWRSGCSHCEDAVPQMNAIYSTFAKDGLKIVAFQAPGRDVEDNPETKWDEVKKWMVERQVTYPVAFDQSSKLRKTYGIELYPMIFVLDRSSKIVYANTGHDQEKALALMNAVQKAIKSKN